MCVVVFPVLPSSWGTLSQTYEDALLCFAHITLISQRLSQSYRLFSLVTLLVRKSPFIWWHPHLSVVSTLPSSKATLPTSVCLIVTPQWRVWGRPRSHFRSLLDVASVVPSSWALSPILILCSLVVTSCCLCVVSTGRRPHQDHFNVL